MDQSTRRRAHARRLYTIYNKRFFSSKLPKILIEVAPGRMGCSTWGETEWDSDGNPTQVTIAEANWSLDAKFSFLKATVLHEQCHVKLGPKVQHDSPEWKAEVLRLSKLGALLETI
jgi:hypothetical protein